MIAEEGDDERKLFTAKNDKDASKEIRYVLANGKQSMEAIVPRDPMAVSPILIQSRWLVHRLIGVNQNSSPYLANFCYTWLGL
jgi:hypothetical protein